MHHQQATFLNSLKRFTDRRVLILFLLGLGAGLPLLLIFSSLSIWLKQAGVARSEITFFSWAALGYGFKYIWAPLIDRVPFPILGRLLGQRRGWLIAAQSMIILSLLGMAITDPAINLAQMAVFAVMLGFSSATQDVVIDAYRIEIADIDLQGLLTASYVTGYRTGMIASGALMLELIYHLSGGEENYHYASWAAGYMTMAAVMGLAIITALMMKEPEIKQKTEDGSFSNLEYIRFFLSFVAGVAGFILCFMFFGKIMPSPDHRLIKILYELLRLILAFTGASLIIMTLFKVHFAPLKLFQTGYVQPVKDVFTRFPLGAVILILLTIGFYRAPDIIMGTSANIFYVDMGYSLTDIARISKAFGLIMTIAGGFLAGLLIVRFGVSPVLLLGVFLAASTNLLFAWLAGIDANINALAVVIVADNISSGLASVAFVAWLSRLTNIQFTAMQYALFSSLMVIAPKLLGGYSGGMIDAMGYTSFYSMTAFLGLPILVLAYLAVKQEEKSSKIQ